MGVFAILMTDSARRQSQDHLGDLVLSPSLTPGALFRCRLDMTSPSGGAGGPGSATDDASRAQTHYTVAWEKSPEALIAGDRLLISSRAFGQQLVELAGPPFQHAGLHGMLAFTVQAIKVDELYPKLATLRALGGSVIEADIPIGVWPSASGVAQPAGETYDYDAEVPYRYHALTRPRNRELVVDGDVFKIVESTPHHNAPRVTLRLRFTSPGG